MCCGYKACRSKVWQLQKFWQVDPLEKVGWIMGSDLAQRYNPNNVEWLVYRKRLLLIDSDKFGFTGTIVELHSAYFWICRHVRKPWANDSIGRSQIDVGSQLYDKGFYNAFQVKRPWLDERAAFPQSRWDENRMDSWDLIQLAVGGTFSDIVWNVAWFVCGKRVMSNATRSHSISILSQGQLSQASRKSRCIHVNFGFSQAGSWWRATHRLWQAICFVIYERQISPRPQAFLPGTHRSHRNRCPGIASWSTLLLHGRLTRIVPRCGCISSQLRNVSNPQKWTIEELQEGSKFPCSFLFESFSCKLWQFLRNLSTTWYGSTSMAWMDPSQEQFTWWQVAHSVQGSLQLLCVWWLKPSRIYYVVNKRKVLSQYNGSWIKMVEVYIAAQLCVIEVLGRWYVTRIPNLWRFTVAIYNMIYYDINNIMICIYIYILFLFWAGLDIALVVNLFWCWRGTYSRKPYIYTYMCSAARVQCLNLELLMLVRGDAVDSRVDYKAN